MKDLYEDSDIRRSPSMICVLAVMLVISSARAAGTSEFEIPIWPGTAPGSAKSTMRQEWRDRWLEWMKAEGFLANRP